MKKIEQQLMTSKWLLVVKEYEQIRQKRSMSFNTVEELCEVFKVHRKDIRKYYEKWVKSGEAEESLLPHKRGVTAILEQFQKQKAFKTIQF